MGGAPAVSKRLGAELIGPDRVWRGELAYGALRVLNGSESVERVSARLNLAEGDVRLLVTRPDGSVKRAYASRLVDSAARIIELPPGMAIESGLALFHAHTGPLFDEPGGYEIVAQYDATPGETVVSPALRVDVRPPKTDEEAELGRLLLEKNVAVSFELGEPAAPGVEKALVAIADRFAERREGRAARLIVAAPEANRKTIDAVVSDIVKAEGAIEAARLITALISPATPNGSLVRESTRKRLERLRSKQVATAIAIVTIEPFSPSSHSS